MMQETSNELVIIDGNSLANRAFYGVPALSNSDGVVTNALYGFLNILLRLLEDEAPSHMVVTFDVGGKVFRHAQFEAYKANRKGMPDDLRSQMPLIREALDLLHIANIGLEGYEGDDLIGTVARRAEANGYQTTIVSGDRDVFQLIDEHTRVFYPDRGLRQTETVDLAHLQEAYDMTPAEVIEMKALQGDSSDNIPGVPGIGKVTAKKLIKTYGTLDEIYRHLEDFKGKKMGDNLAQYKEQAYMSHALATIDCAVPLDFELEDFRVGEPDVEGLRGFYSRLELKSLLDRLEAAHGAAELEADAPGMVLEGEDAVAMLRNMVPDTYALYLARDKKGAFQWMSLANEAGEAVSLVHENAKALFSALAELLHDEQTALLTEHWKEDYHLLQPYGLWLPEPAWDLALVDYLLSPERTDHDVAGAVAHYLGRPLAGEGPAQGLDAARSLFVLRDRLTPMLRDASLEALLNKVEIPVRDILSRMEDIGVQLNIPYLEALQVEFDERIRASEAHIYALAGHAFKVNSPKQLGVVLFEELGLPIIKKTKTGYSTDAEVLDTLRGEHEIIEEILRYRQITKLKSTYVDGLLALADDTGKVHTTFNQVLTATGRLSSREPNLQNIPVRTEEGRRIRQAFVPSGREQVMIAADYSQIELRVLAHMSGDEGMIAGFRNQEDIHRRTASEVFHVAPEEVTPDLRRAAKAVNFGIIYGQTDFGLARELGITRAEAKDYIERYFSRYPRVQAWIEETVEAARRDGYVTTLFDRRRPIRDIHSRNFNLRSFAERTAVNTPIQGTAADIIKMAMVEVDHYLREKGIKARLLLQVHDELIFEAPPEEVAILVAAVKRIMEGVVKLDVPLEVDVKVGFNWQEMERV